jgi:23S rRNA pseudouridine2605 synthase
MGNQDTPNIVRLNRFIADALQISRRRADDLIFQGKINLNSKEAKLGDKVNLKEDKVFFQGKILKLETNKEVELVILNKPKGYLSSTKSQNSKPTLYDLLPQKYASFKIAGRLDLNSSGLIVLTNSGSIVYELTHPKNNKTKNYNVEVNKPLDLKDLAKIKDGITIDSTGRPSLLKIIKNTNNQFFEIELTEGRNRQIRRTFEKIGFRVKKLHRTNLGEYSLPTNLKVGDFKVIKP